MKDIAKMNKREVLEFFSTYLREYAKDLDKVTTGNLAHRIANLKHGLINMSALIEDTLKNGNNNA